MDRTEAFASIASMLRIPAEKLMALDARMAAATGRTTVIEDLAAENAKRVLLIRNMFGLYKNASSEQAYSVLLDALRQSDAELYELFRQPDGTTLKGLQTLFNFEREFAAPGKGYFLKVESAKRMLREYPPQTIISSLGYASVDELLDKEDVFEVFAALRAVEGAEWLNAVFFKAYETLTAKDFEERTIVMTVLAGKWLPIAKKFQRKKYHNVSHLKEMGLIFIIPERIDTPGETMRLFSLLGHYLHEVNFYAKLFRRHANAPDFGKKVISLLRGDLPNFALAEGGERPTWLVVPRYMAKEDENHPVLFTPHVSPEAIYWRYAERDIAQLNDRYPLVNVGFWYNLDSVGDFFQNESDGFKKLVSFALLDNIMALVVEKHQIKYLYHQQEALWNRLFMEYMGIDDEALERMMLEHFEQLAITV